MLLFALVLLSAPQAGPDVPRPAVHAAYRFRIDDPRDGRVECSARFDGLPATVELSLPERIAFASPPAPRLVGEVELVSDGGELARLGPFRWRLEPAGGSAELRWTVPLDHRSLPSARRSSYELPYLDADHGFLVTATLALAPEVEGPAEIRVNFELPVDWDLVVPWPATASGYDPGAWQRLQNDLVAVGAWNVTHLRAAGVDVDVAFAPTPARLGEELGQEISEKIGAVIAREVELFGRVPNERYSFFFGKSQMGGLGGSVKSTSMTLLVDPNLPAAFVRDHILHLIAHEYHHTWMHSLEVVPNEAELHFVSEGFTDYYAHLVPWWLGFDDDAELLAALGGKLAEFEESQSSRARTVVEAGGAAFYEDPSAYAAVYSGGLVVALLTELAIARHSDEHDLDAFLRALIDGPRESPEQPAGLRDYFALVAQYAGDDFAELSEELVHHPGAPDLVATFAAVGIEVVRSEAPHDLSVLRANLDGATLGGIDSSDPARMVGLRTGDRLLAVNGRDVLTADEVREAWARPVDGRVRVVYERDGVEEQLDLPVPKAIDYVLSPEVLAALRRD